MPNYKQKYFTQRTYIEQQGVYAIGKGDSSIATMSVKQNVLPCFCFAVSSERGKSTLPDYITLKTITKCDPILESINWPNQLTPV